MLCRREAWCLFRCLPTRVMACSAMNYVSTETAAASRPRRSEPFMDAAGKREVDTLRKDMAAAQLRIAELQMSQLAVHDSLLRRLEETDREAHKAAVELQYTALALRCHHDLLETELRRVLAIEPAGDTLSDEERDNIRRGAIEAGTREMVRRNIGFRVEKVSEEPAATTAASTR